MSEIRTQTIALSGIAVPPERLRALRPEVVDKIAASIKEQGLLHPVLLRPRSRNGIGYILVAGRHRLEAVRKLGHQDIRAEIHDNLKADEALLAEIDENLVRANLSPAEEALHLAKREQVYLALHPQTKSGGNPGAGRGKGKRRPLEDSQSGNPPNFTKDTVAKTGKSKSAIYRSKARGKNIAEPVLQKVIGTSIDKPEQLDALSQLPPERQSELADEAAAGKTINVKAEVKKEARAARERQLSTKQLALPDIKFGVIVEDYEWDFEVWSRETGMDRHAANHYPVSRDAHTAEEIVERTKDRLACAAEDCVLWMWTTVPHLAIAIDVLRLRGFRYVSNYAWGKDKAGTGLWSRNKHEHLLIGVRGSIPCPAPGTQWDSLIMAPVGDHSAKPECFLEMLDEYFPNLPKVELNRRGPPRPGWHAWGWEAEAAE